MFAPCRFCGDQRVTIEYDRDAEAYFAECDYCGASGPVMDSEDAARDAWYNGMPECRDKFICPDCGVGVAADEDGCCANCGADCHVVRAAPGWGA